jgi:hypothetical protein
MRAYLLLRFFCIFSLICWTITKKRFASTALSMSFSLLLGWSILGFLIALDLPYPQCYPEDDFCIPAGQLFALFCGVPTAIAWIAWLAAYDRASPPTESR